MAYRSALAAVALAAVTVTGCGPGFTSKKASSPSATAKQPAIGQATTTAAGGPAGPKRMGEPSGPQTPSVFTPGLSLSDMIAHACGIPARAAGGAATPSFEFDSAALEAADREMLGDLARCLTEGALRGKSVALVGRADARGEPEYNMTLGESRADAVQRYLVDLGVGKDRMRATSRGEIDATGADEAGWARDRRVDIELAL